jgi:outer membrane protein assembly factor BamB
MKINPSLKGHLPKVEPPVAFASPDGRTTGWRVTVPGRRPLATPALADGRLFLGGGFGSYDFYAFDADSGRVAWQYQTGDDGPTAAVVGEGFVAFNTESCELEVLTLAGRAVWKKWLGDPLMSMPAVSGGRVYAVFPDSNGDREHYLACFGLDSGREFWRTPIRGEIISAPTLADERVYLTTLDGTLHCIRQQDGHTEWQEAKDATSSPVVWNRRCYFSRRKEVVRQTAEGATPQQTESVAGRGTDPDSSTVTYPGTVRDADYLDYAKRRAGSPLHKMHEAADAGVGFGFHKGHSKMAHAMHNLGKGSVAGVWSYQGSKPFVYRGRLFSALGDTVHCLDPETEAVHWKQQLGVHGEGAALLDSALTPPATVNGKLFVGTLSGEVYCQDAATGAVLWSVNVGEPIVFQPAVWGGRVFVPTYGGSLFGLRTDDAKDDGWLAWGATAAHNGLAE